MEMKPPQLQAGGPGQIRLGHPLSAQRVTHVMSVSGLSTHTLWGGTGRGIAIAVPHSHSLPLRQGCARKREIFPHQCVGSWGACGGHYGPSCCSPAGFWAGGLAVGSPREGSPAPHRSSAKVCGGAEP